MLYFDSKYEMFGCLSLSMTVDILSMCTVCNAYRYTKHAYMYTMGLLCVSKKSKVSGNGES